MFTYRYLLLLCTVTIFFAGCKKELREARPHYQTRKHIDETVQFSIENTTGNTVFVTCFYYVKKYEDAFWQWHKTKVQKVEVGSTVTITIPLRTLPERRHDVYGALGIFATQLDAENSIYELLSEDSTIELNQIHKIAHKKMILQTENYGFRGERLDYTLHVQKTNEKEVYPELDFWVENKTGKDVYITCFVYQRKHPYHVQWNLDKTPVLSLKRNEKKRIDVDTITRKYDRNNTRGYLAVFESNQKKAAEEAIFELLKPDQTILLGRLKPMSNKKIVLIPKRYGLLSGFDDRHSSFRYKIAKHHDNDQHKKAIPW